MANSEWLLLVMMLLLLWRMLLWLLRWLHAVGVVFRQRPTTLRVRVLLAVIITITVSNQPATTTNTSATREGRVSESLPSSRRRRRQTRILNKTWAWCTKHVRRRLLSPAIHIGHASRYTCQVPSF